MKKIIQYHHSIRFLIVAVLTLLGIPSSSQAQSNEIEANAKNILDKHCARCHQTEKLAGRFKDRPGGNFGYVLDVDNLKKKNQIKPGLAESSPLFIKMKSGEMPKDIDDDCYLLEVPKGSYCGPNEGELKVVKDWINQISQPTVKIAREFIEDNSIISYMLDDLSKISEFVRPQIRYITLTHLYNAGDDEKTMDSYRQAVRKLLNSLSFESGFAKIEAIDKNKTILRLNIKELGWDADKWDLLIKFNPYVTFFDNPKFKSLQSEAKTIQPFLRGDWMTFAASQPPLYHDLLGLPDTKQELEKLLGLNVKDNINKLRVARAGFQKSGVSRNNRLIERHTSRTGAYWESYDFAGNAERQSFFKYPIGPQDILGDLGKQFGFEHDGGEVIFELPNGFHGYYLTDAKGNRINQGPTNIVSDPSRRDLAVTNGISCMGCHDQGIKYNPHRPRESHDQVRDQVTKSLRVPLKAQEIIETIYPKHKEFYDLMASDAKRYEAALTAANINMNLKPGGVELVNNLFQRFEDDLTIELAAAELGMKKEQFEKLTNSAGGDVYDLRLRLENDLVPRDQFVKEYALLLNTLTKNRAIDFKQIAKYAGENTVKVSTSRPPKYSKKFDLAFYPNQRQFVKGQNVSFTLKSEQPCYLTLLNVDDQNRVAVIFPNKHYQDNKIERNVTYNIPGRNITGFTFRFAKTGKEKVIATCNASRPDPIGISHDFSKRTFTTFDNYDEMLTRSVRDRVGSRLIDVVPDKSSNSLRRERLKKMPSLLQNPIDSHIDIQAQKAVLLNVREK